MLYSLWFTHDGFTTDVARRPNQRPPARKPKNLTQPSHAQAAGRPNPASAFGTTQVKRVCGSARRRVDVVMLRYIRSRLRVILSLRNERGIHTSVLFLLDCSVRLPCYITSAQFLAALISAFYRVGRLGVYSFSGEDTRISNASKWDAYALRTTSLSVTAFSENTRGPSSESWDCKPVGNARG